MNALPGDGLNIIGINLTGLAAGGLDYIPVA